MRTTLEIADSTRQRAKTVAAAKGITVKQLFTEAIEVTLSQFTKPTGDAEPLWMKGFGGLADLRAENARIMKLIDDEFEQVEPEDRQ